MQLDAIRDAVRQAPFQPFQLKLSNGATIDFNKNGRLIVGNGFIVRTFEKNNSFELYQADDIESLQFLPSKTPSATGH